MRDKIEVSAALLRTLLLPFAPDPDSIHKKELDSLQKLLRYPRWHISGRRWTQRGTGNTYHVVTIYENGEPLWTSPEKYGYGDQFITTAFAWLIKEGRLPPCERGSYGTLDLRETFGGTYEVRDCTTRREMLP